MLEKSEIFTIDVHYSVQHHGINQIYRATLKLENQQTIVIGPKSILLLNIEIWEFFKISS